MPDDLNQSAPEPSAPERETRELQTISTQLERLAARIPSSNFEKAAIAATIDDLKQQAGQLMQNAANLDPQLLRNVQEAIALAEKAAGVSKATEHENRNPLVGKNAGEEPEQTVSTEEEKAQEQENGESKNVFDSALGEVARASLEQVQKKEHREASKERFKKHFGESAELTEEQAREREKRLAKDTMNYGLDALGPDETLGFDLLEQAAEKGKASKGKGGKDLLSELGPDETLGLENLFNESEVTQGASKSKDKQRGKDLLSELGPDETLGLENLFNEQEEAQEVSKTSSKSVPTPTREKRQEKAADEFTPKKMVEAMVKQGVMTTENRRGYGLYAPDANLDRFTKKTGLEGPAPAA